MRGVRFDGVNSTGKEQGYRDNKSGTFCFLTTSIIIAFMNLSIPVVLAQSKGYYDTLSLAKQMMAERRIVEAKGILEVCKKKTSKRGECDKVIWPGV